MKTKKPKNIKKKKEIKYEKAKDPRKEGIGVLLLGVLCLTISIGFMLVFYRPFVPWKKIVCSEEEGNYIEINKSDVKYIYEIDGVKYEKILKNVPYDAQDSYPERERNIIYVNLNDPYDVKHGSRGGLFVVIVNAMFFTVGVYFMVKTIQIFYQMKHPKTKKRKT